MGLWYPKDTGFELTAFLDSDHAGCLDSRKSTSGGIQFLGGDKLVSWSSKKQDCTSMSLAEAELWLSIDKIRYVLRHKGSPSHLVLSSPTIPYQAIDVRISLHKGAVPVMRTSSMVESKDALVTRMASTAAKPYQEDSYEFYLSTCIIYTD
ncbi:hypothetical protein Tco_0411336 [Tanacetum coccineum]